MAGLGVAAFLWATGKHDDPDSVAVTGNLLLKFSEGLPLGRGRSFLVVEREVERPWTKAFCGPSGTRSKP